ncbi:hypothetical protein NDU88_005747 [Pleurodeles waltl]|uniref:Uncharacterized protein n=1 Tax=Pleurodeles waltl TaxID=8319 RepID=A0AAV7NR97_PLEWA|nr:hypothetical protein NDU88_005747 [Pleurodeles waltl]
MSSWVWDWLFPFIDCTGAPSDSNEVLGLLISARETHCCWRGSLLTHGGSVKLFGLSTHCLLWDPWPSDRRQGARSHVATLSGAVTAYRDPGGLDAEPTAEHKTADLSGSCARTYRKLSSNPERFQEPGSTCGC